MQKTLLISGFASLLGIGFISGNSDNYPINEHLLTVIDSTYIEEIDDVVGGWVKDTYTVDLTPIKLTDKEINDNRLIQALIQVESNGKENCVGDRHLIVPSIGVLQIRPIMVKEVNRILKRQGKDKRYKNKDRYSRVKSIEMFIIWRDFHHKGHDNEIIARCWNGGPKGWKRKATLHYWDKVQKALKKIA